MKKTIVALTMVLAMSLGMSLGANAAPYQFEDLIDNWGPYGLSDTAMITQSNPLSYQHDINQEVDFAAGDLVTEAYLELDFTNDTTDDAGSVYFWGICVFRWDFREYATYRIEEDGTVYGYNLGEVDNGSYDALYLDIDWLNDDGLLDVSISVRNNLGMATAYLDHSRLYGTADTPETAPVPEPATLVLLGSGLLGLAGFRRKKS